MSLRINRLAVAMTVAVAAACLLGAVLFIRHHVDDLQRSAQESAERQAGLIRLTLEHQMQENKRDLIADMVASFARDPSIDEVRILDRVGRTRFAAGTETNRGVTFEPTCVPCHDAKGAGQQSAVRHSSRGDIMRVVLPIENREQCHECHEPTDTVNGALLVDVRAEAIADAVNRDLRWLVVVIGGIALGLLVTIAFSVRLLVMKRLEQFEAVARQIAGGQLERRLPSSGGDTLSWMARAFNAMADSVMRLATELRGQRELLEMVINSVDDGIAVLDKKLTVVAANEAFLTRTGHPPGGTAGGSCQGAHGRACPADTCPARTCFRTGERQYALVTRVAPDGARVIEELHASPIRNGQGVVAVVEVWRDITERRTNEARLAEAHRMASLGMLASGYSHELNTPLGTTLTCLEAILRLLQEEAPAPAGERQAVLNDYAQTGREQILRCRGITQQFLQLSRGQKTSTDLVDLTPIVQAVARLVEPTARERGVAVRCQGAELGQAVVRASDAELQQVLLNLSLNAIQACASGGAVELSVETTPVPRIVVSDTGRGIPHEQLGKIFEPFYSLRPGGTGLGLFLSLEMAHGWGADIVAHSEVGKGSTFEVVFGALGPRRAEA